MNRIDWAGTRSNEEMATGLLFDWAPTFIDGIILIDGAIAGDEAPFVIAIPPAVTEGAVAGDAAAAAGVGTVAASDGAVASDEPTFVAQIPAAASDGAVAADDLNRATESTPEEDRFKARRWTYSRDDV